MRIGDDVEIGANTCVDRGALDDTVIEDGVKLDNLIQIGHNVRIGKHSAMAGCVGVAGSATIGAHCTGGGGAIVLGPLTLADNVHVSAASVVKEALAQARSLAQGTGVAVQDLLTVPPFAAETVTTDAAKLLQILMALYDNAIRYTGAGGAVTTLMTVTDAALNIEIFDDGIGLDEGEAENMFQRNFRGAKARKMRSDGAGLGLAIAKNLADALHVSLDLENRHGAGCCARIRVPRHG